MELSNIVVAILAIVFNYTAILSSPTVAKWIYLRFFKKKNRRLNTRY